MLPHEIITSWECNRNTVNRFRMVPFYENLLRMKNAFLGRLKRRRFFRMLWRDIESFPSRMNKQTTIHGEKFPTKVIGHTLHIVENLTRIC